MYKFNRALGALTCIIMALSTPSTADAQSNKTGVTNVVLVHGAFADGSSWSKVIPLLEAKGLTVIAVQNPLTSLADDVAAAKRAIALQNGPVLLVGHSWGGAVITEAGNDPNVAGLVYVAAGAPDEGQSFGEMSQLAPPAPGTGEIRPDASGFLSLTAKGIKEDFAQDLPEAETRLIFATQGPWSAKALSDKISKAAWKTKPSWYIAASEDRMINPDLQQTLAKKIKATTLTIKASHVPMVSQPEKVAAFILEAASHVTIQ
ncbi:alpha/beta fold hydrolase [Spirosoma gilvum]